MFRASLLTLLATAAALGLWHLLDASAAPRDELSTVAAETPGRIARRPDDRPAMRVTGAEIAADGTAAHAPGASAGLADLHVQRIDVRPERGRYLGAEVLAALRRRVRVRFDPPELVERFERALLGGDEELPSDGILGVDLLRLAHEAGFQTADRAGALVVTEIPNHGP